MRRLTRESFNQRFIGSEKDLFILLLHTRTHPWKICSAVLEASNVLTPQYYISEGSSQVFVQNLIKYKYIYIYKYTVLGLYMSHMHTIFFFNVLYYR